jgi:hypothetical protein
MRDTAIAFPPPTSGAGAPVAMAGEGVLEVTVAGVESAVVELGATCRGGGLAAVVAGHRIGQGRRGDRRLAGGGVSVPPQGSPARPRPRRQRPWARQSGPQQPRRHRQEPPDRPRPSWRPAFGRRRPSGAVAGFARGRDRAGSAVGAAVWAAAAAAAASRRRHQAAERPCRSMVGGPWRDRSPPSWRSASAAGAVSVSGQRRRGSCCASTAAGSEPLSRSPPRPSSRRQRSRSGPGRSSLWASDSGRRQTGGAGRRADGRPPTRRAAGWTGRGRGARTRARRRPPTPSPGSVVEKRNRARPCPQRPGRPSAQVGRRRLARRQARANAVGAGLAGAGLAAREWSERRGPGNAGTSPSTRGGERSRRTRNGALDGSAAACGCLRRGVGRHAAAGRTGSAEACADRCAGRAT